MPNITVAEKKNAIAELVCDTMRERVIALRKETDEHWLAVVTELFDEAAITRCNNVVEAVHADKDHMQLALPGDRWEPNRASGDEARLRTVVLAAPPGADLTDPLELEEYATGENDLLATVWEECRPDVTFDLPIPMVVITDQPIPKDRPGQCSLNDPAKYRDDCMEIEIDTYIPTDCTTQRRFKEAARELSETINKLTKTLENAVSRCRTDTAVVKAVPELGPYINTAEAEAAAIGSLLADARNG